mgnify:FL=1
MRIKDILKCELIGLAVEVVSAKNPSLNVIRGKVVDETKYTLVIETVRGVKRLIKSQVTLKMNMEGKTVEVEGSALVGRSEERIKKR